MVKAKWILIAMLLYTQARAQVPISEAYNKTVKHNFSSVYETNEYFNEMEEAIELKYANMKVPVFEKMELPQDSLYSIEDQVEMLKEEIRLTEFNFIHWEKNYPEPRDQKFKEERALRQEDAKNKILKMRLAIDALESRKIPYVRELRLQQMLLSQFDREKEKELQKAKLERQAALVKMYRA